MRKTHPSGRGRDNFPGLEGEPQISPQTLPSRSFPIPNRPPPPPGTRTGRWEEAVGGARAGRSVSGEARLKFQHGARVAHPAQGRAGDALPPSTGPEAVIRLPSRGPAGPAKNRRLRHPRALSRRPRPRETSSGERDLGRARRRRGRAGVGP